MKRIIRSSEELKNPNVGRFIFNAQQDIRRLIKDVESMVDDASTEYQAGSLKNTIVHLKAALKYLEGI